MLHAICIGNDSMNARTKSVLALVTVAFAMAGAAAGQDEGPILRPKKPATKPSPTATLLVMCDLACSWKLDGEAKGRIDAGGSAKVKVELGQHFVVATTEDGLDQVKQLSEVRSTSQTVVNIELKPVHETRLKTEQEARDEAEREKKQREDREAREKAAHEQQEKEKAALEEAALAQRESVQRGRMTDVRNEADSATTEMSAAQIVDRNVFARGGLEAWRAIHTLSLTGKLGTEATGQLPFVMQLVRPRKLRLEIQFKGQSAVQVYDGSNGWKLRPFLGRQVVEPFTTEELTVASMQDDLDGPLVDYAAKGTQVTFEVIEKVEGHDAFKLRLDKRGGQVRRVWIDTQTFLELKIEGTPRRLGGKMSPVEIFYRDYKSVNGLMVPYVLETIVKGVKQSEKINIESVALNPQLDDALFTAPKSP